VNSAPRSRLLSVFGGLAWLHLWAGALLTAWVIATFGAPLAMGLRMMSGETEPAVPQLAFPWLLVVPTWILPIPWVWRRRWGLAGVATLPAVAAPLLHFGSLYAATSP